MTVRLPKTPEEILRHIGKYDGVGGGIDLHSLEDVIEAKARLATLMALAAELEHEDLYTRGLNEMELAMFLHENACARWEHMESLVQSLHDAEDEFRRERREEILKSEPMA